MSKIGKVEVHAFQFDAHNLGFTRGEGVGAFGYKKDSKIRDTKYATVIMTDSGLRGEYVAQWVRRWDKH